MFLEVSQLDVRYAGRAQAAVHGVSLGLHAGDIGVLIGPSMEAAIACLPPGWKWKCTAHDWSAWGRNWNTGTIEHPRSVHVELARDELLRLAAKAWQAEEYR